MATTTPHSNNELVKYARKVWAQGYLRENRLTPYQGGSPNSIIRIVRDLAADGKQINVPLVDQMRGSGYGTGTLTGNEESIDNYGFPMWADYLRHATRWQKSADRDSSFNFREIATPLLNNWYKARLRDETVLAMLSIPQATVPTGFRGPVGSRINGIPWASASAGQRNAWMDANSDRVIFGSALGNYVAGNFGTSAANVDTTNDRLTANVVSLAKRVAMNTTQNKITPYTVESNMQEQYLMFVGSRSMRDLKSDTTIANALREMIPKSSEGYASPLFRAGDVMWDNVIVTEIPEIDTLLTLTGIGASSSNVVPAFLCGASAMAIVTAEMPTPTTADETDYQFNTGLGIEGQYGVGKIAKIPAGGSVLKDWGMVSLFLSSVADA
jgi:hypothetical protein